MFSSTQNVSLHISRDDETMVFLPFLRTGTIFESEQVKKCWTTLALGLDRRILRVNPFYSQHHTGHDLHRSEKVQVNWLC